MILFSSLSKRRGATLAGVFSLALSSVLLLCGAGSAPLENFLPQGAMQGDLNAGGHNLTNAATVYATNVVVSGSLTAPSSFTLPFSKLTSTPATLSGYGITDAEPALGNPSANGYVLSSTTGGTRSWIAPGGGGGSLTLGSGASAVGFSATGLTLNLANVNLANGLAQLDGSGNLTLAGGVNLTGASSFDGGQITTTGTGILRVGTGSTIGVGGAYATFSVAAIGPAAAGFLLNRDDASSQYDSVDLIDSGNTGTGWSIQLQPGSDTLHLVNRSLGSDALAIDNASNNISFFGATSLDNGAITTDGMGDLVVASINIGSSNPPGSSSASGTPGQIAYDSTYFYVCVSANTWKRAALSTW